jgi:hypothetical protein
MFSSFMLISIGGVVGCGARSRLDGDGAGGSPEPEPTSSPNECVEACADARPNAAELFVLLGNQCICMDCSGACAAAFCELGELPVGECLACTQTALLGDQCQNHEGLFGTCLGSGSECATFTQCLLTCDP